MTYRIGRNFNLRTASIFVASVLTIKSWAAAVSTPQSAANNSRMVLFIIIDKGIYDKYNVFQTFLLSLHQRKTFTQTSGAPANQVKPWFAAGLRGLSKGDA